MEHRCVTVSDGRVRNEESSVSIHELRRGESLG